MANRGRHTASFILYSSEESPSRPGHEWLTILCHATAVPSSQRQACCLWTRRERFACYAGITVHWPEAHKLSGFEIVTKISEIPIDEKARPKQPVVVSNCGELVLRKKNVISTAPLSDPPRGRSLSPSRSRTSRRRSPPAQKGKRRHSFSSGSRSRSPYTRSRSPTPPQKPRKHKKSAKTSKEKESTNSGVPGKRPIAETEEELDARYIAAAR